MIHHFPHFPRKALVETLLNSAEAETYTRGPLLLALVDELAATAGFEAAADAARAIVQEVQEGDLPSSDFVIQVRALRHLIHTLACVNEPNAV